MRAALGLVVVLLLLSGCEVTATGRAIRDVTEGRGIIAPTCSLGSELRVTEINGLPATCVNDQLDMLEVAVDALDRDIVGIVIELEGSEDTLNISHYPSKRKVVIRYEVHELSKTVGQLQHLNIYPVADIGGEKIPCDSHPLKVELDIC